MRYNVKQLSIGNKTQINDSRYYGFIKYIKVLLCIFFFVFVSTTRTIAQTKDLTVDTKQAMMNATKFMVEKISVNGGYVSLYLPDLSRRWAELEAYKSQIGVYSHSPGTVAMGNLFLSCYYATGDEYYYHAAEKAAKALISGQLSTGGWNYIIDFAGDRSLKQWYNTIGKNAWGWDEYNNYYGTATFKDGSTEEPAMFLLRMYLKKLDPQFKPALDKAIGVIIESQYPLGGWPQRYPQRIDRQFIFGGKPDYTSHYVFNREDVTWRNIKFLIQCYKSLGEERFLDPIQRGMNFYLITQQGNPQGGWGLQYDMELKPTYARQYEPTALSAGQTYNNIMLLIQFYKYTGQRKFLSRIPDAIQWLENSRLPDDETEGGKYTHPVFIEIGTNKGIYAHRKGTGVSDGHYWVDYSDEHPLLHYGAKTHIDIAKLKEEYAKVNALTVEEATKNSPLLEDRNQGDSALKDYFEPDISLGKVASDQEVRTVIKLLDNQYRWLSKHEWVSRPYSVSETGMESNTAPLSTEDGDQIRDSSDQQYISTREYLKNMGILINYITNEP